METGFTTVSVIVLSYNRPRMLGEALRSIHDADEILVVDDGSDFDVEDVVRKNVRPGLEFRVILKPSLTPEQRAVTPRVGLNMNEAIRSTNSEVIAYLCDDDVFASDWIRNVKKHYDSGEDDHWVRGWWGKFDDPDSPLELEDPMHHLRCNIMGLPPHGLTTGSFVHLRRCAFRCKVWWSEESVAVHDCFLVAAFAKRHGVHKAKHINVAAGWRRLHPFNMLKHTAGAEYTASGRAVIGGMLE